MSHIRQVLYLIEIMTLAIPDERLSKPFVDLCSNIVERVRPLTLHICYWETHVSFSQCVARLNGSCHIYSGWK